MTSQISNSEPHGLTPFGLSKKRKERDHQCDPHPPRKTTRAEPSEPALLQPRGADGNRLLAGYLAHEFLTRGTLFGEPWGLAAAEGAKEPIEQPKPGKAPRAYAEVAYLLKTEGAHVPGVVNPAELARWLQM